MSNNHTNLRYLFNKLADNAATYNNIKSNGEERFTNTRLGRRAIRYNVFFFLFLGSAAALGILAMFLLRNSNLIFGIPLLLIAVGLAVTSIIFLILALDCGIKQIKLNKKPIGIISILLTLFILLAAIAAIVIAAAAGFSMNR